MMDSNTTTQQIAHPLNLRQFLVRPMKTDQAALKEDVHLTLLGRRHQIRARQARRVLFTLLLREREYHHRQERLFLEVADQVCKHVLVLLVVSPSSTTTSASTDWGPAASLRRFGFGFLLGQCVRRALVSSLEPGLSSVHNLVDVSVGKEVVFQRHRSLGSADNVDVLLFGSSIPETRLLVNESQTSVVTHRAN